MTERIYLFLESRPDGATSEEIASSVLNLRGARGVIADKIVAAAVEGDARFFRGANGVWALKPVLPATPFREVVFTTLGGRIVAPTGAGSEQLVGVAARRVRIGAPDGRMLEVALGDAPEERTRAIEAFATFSSGTVPVAFRLSRFKRLMRRAAGEALGAPVLTDGICLYRLGRRVFSDEPLPSLNALAEALDLPYLTDREPEAEAALQAEALLMLLEECEFLGTKTVEEVVADLYPDATPVRFESFAFDAAFLSELPQEPGIYIMRDRDGRVIYVGKSVNLRDRVGTYFARRSERPEKTQRILERIWSVDVETVGSELEALLLEARLIRLCEPEFNTQVKVHPRNAALGSLRNFTLVLPSAEPDHVALFCVRKGHRIEQVCVRRDGADSQEVAEKIRDLYFGEAGAASSMTDEDAADLEILSSWLVLNSEKVNLVDMDATGPVDDALRVLGDYILKSGEEGWEKVWRV